MTGRDRNEGRGRDEKFVRDVLARTSGSACERACRQLPDLVDGALQGLDRQLVQSHLGHCPGCRRVAVVLGWLTPELPAMAEIDPGPDFTAAVLARTTGYRRAAAAVARPGGAAGLMDRLGRWWEKRILSPAFPVQAAYAATVLLVLLTAVPGAPLKGVPGKALETVQAGPSALPVFGPAFAGAAGWLDARAAGIRDGIADDLGDRWRKTETSLTLRSDRSQAEWTRCRGHFDQTIDMVREGQLGQATYELFGACKAGVRAWKEWWNDDEDN